MKNSLSVLKQEDWEIFGAGLLDIVKVEVEAQRAM